MINLKKEEFKKFNILVIGDTCIDKFTYGVASRLAPEAPVPVFNPSNFTSNPGMAGNVSRNIEALGANVILVANNENIIKNRYVDDRTGHILLRVDDNDKVKRISSNIIESLKNNQFNGKYVDAIIISDYNKGFLEEDDIKYICENNDNVFIDTKKIINGWCINASFIKINNVEYEHTKYSLKKLNLKDKLIITLSNKGCKYMDEIFPVKKVDIRDVSGAGDTFISGLVVEYIRTKDIKQSILFAQECATVVVQKPGVSTI
jgi:D-beta-D-heptose 7-phosphate kinase/D-beta-D-heptose 1-phosphate adenosyltransferase